MEHGLIHIYCGEGKGKTSAAIGLAVRAAGRGKKVLFARFLKTEDSGEVKILDGIDGISVMHLEKDYGFYKTLTHQEKNEMKKMYEHLWFKIRKEVRDEQFDVLVMDEIMAAVRYGLVPEKEVAELLGSKTEKLEIILTGRDPGKELMNLADYVSEIHKIRHPYDKGIPAREGIEY